MPTWLSLWKEIADAVSSTATALAIIAAAVWFFRQRLRHPRANIQLDVEHWPVRGRYLLRARVRLSNGGTVAIQGRSLLVRVQQVIPLVPDIEEKVAADADPVLAGETEVLWPMLGSRECGWNRGERLVEPGETDESHFEFVVPGAIDLVHVYAYFKNTSRWPWQRPLGWHVTIAHSLGAEGSYGKSECEADRGAGHLPRDNRHPHRHRRRRDNCCYGERAPSGRHGPLARPKRAPAGHDPTGDTQAGTSTGAQSKASGDRWC